MVSGKQSKKKRRQPTPPPVRSKGQSHRQASPRVLFGGALALALVVVGVVLGLVLSAGSSKANVPQGGSLRNALPAAAEVQRSLQGIAQRGTTLGAAAAPVTLVEYIDLQCPYCQQFETQAMPTLISKYVRSGKVKVQVRLLGFIGPDSQRGRAAALAAGDQNKLFNFAQLLYTNQGIENSGWLNDRMITSAAASIPGLDVPELLSQRSSAAVREAGNASDAEATASGVNATPTIFVGKRGKAPRRVALASPTDVNAVAAAINAALR